MNPFEGYTIYGPYFGIKEGRNLIVLVSPMHRTTMSYARYLMCIQEGRWLESYEEVDHIDDNKMNDVIENLEIVSHQYNSTKGKSLSIVILTCPQCKIDFVRERRQTHLTKGGDQTFCSRSCSAKYLHLNDGIFGRQKGL